MTNEENARFWARAGKTVTPLVITASLLGARVNYRGEHPPGPPPPRNLERRLRLEEASLGPLASARVKYAVLIQGATNPDEPKGAHLRTVLAYGLLRDIGFREENIYVLAPRAGRDRWPSVPRDDLATRDSIRITFDHLRRVVDGNDTLFVYFIGHGNNFLLTHDRRTGRRLQGTRALSWLALDDGVMLQSTFYDYLEGIAPGAGILLFGQCMPGGFAEELARRGSRRKHLRKYLAIVLNDSWGDSWRKGDREFGSAFLEAHSTARAAADYNRDGSISIAEAFAYAKANDEPTKKGLNHPRLTGRPDPHGIFLEL